MSSSKIEHYTLIDDRVFSLIKKLDQSLFPQPWSDSVWEGVGKVDREYLLSVCFIDNEVVSFALFRLNPYEDLSHLLKVLVVPKFRGMGQGLKLLEQSYTELCRLGFYKRYLEVAVDNQSAIRTYSKLGLVEVNRVKRFYSNGDDAIIMADSD